MSDFRSAAEKTNPLWDIKTELNTLMCVSGFGFCEHYFNPRAREKMDLKHVRGISEGLESTVGADPQLKYVVL